MTDPRNDLRPSDPLTRRSDGSAGMWGWIAGVAVLVLIAIILIAGWNNDTRTASNTLVPRAAITGSATAPKTPLATTTGSAPMSHPATPPKQ